MKPLDDDKELSVMLGSLERRGPWNVPQDLTVNVMWGNAELDLREATLQPGTTTIHVQIKMGNLELVVPPGIPVDMHVTPVLGNAENHRARPDDKTAQKQDAERLADAHQSSHPAFFDPYRDPARAAEKRIRVVGKVKLGNVEVHELRIGESLHDSKHERHASNSERRHLRHMQNMERHSRRHFENEARRRFRRDGKRSRWHQRLHDLQDEKEMWRKDAQHSQWMPWWLHARMRRRIFIWLAIAVCAGFAVGYYVDGRPPWWAFLLGFFGISAVSGAIAFRLTKPLIMVVRAAREIGDGKLDTRLPVDDRGGEIPLLANALNEMAGKIQQQMADQRQLLAAVSHELRTPLGHMRVLVETARDTKNTDVLEGMEREILMLDDLVGKLLASSRLEFGKITRHPLDLGTLVTDTATSAGIVPESIEAIGDVVAPVDPTLVKRALSNLIDNAKTHAGGPIAVRVERRANLVAIEVDDAGPGVPADRKADSFRAFVPSTGGGLGLGLALVSRIAVAHGGGAWIQDRPGGGARIGFSINTADAVPVMETVEPADVAATVN